MKNHILIISDVVRNFFCWGFATFRFIHIDISTAALKVGSSTFLPVWKSKREHFLNKKKCFSFLFKSSFWSWKSNFNFSDIQISWGHLMECLSMKHETHFAEQLGKKHSLVIKFMDQCYVTLQEKSLFQKSLWKMLPGN